MKITNKSIVKMIVMVMVAMSLFTILQAYYSAYLQLFLLVVCYFICGKAQGKTYLFIFGSAIIYVVLMIIDMIKGVGGPMDNIGIFLHYVTWPVLFVCVQQTYDRGEIKQLLYVIIAFCIIGDILSLIQLGIDPDVSRKLAGAFESHEMMTYYKKGVGGYGYVFAMTFLTFGTVRLLLLVEKVWEKAYLIAFLVINALFILYASYTTAIVMTILMATAAAISETQHKFRTVFLAALGAVVIIYFGVPITRFCYELAQRINLPWVAKRFGQLLYAQEGEDLDSLHRVMLYRRSWNTFLANPFFGGRAGDAISGHSQMLDSFAKYGLVSGLVLLLFENGRRLCYRILRKNNLTVFFASFFVFIFIDTCASMQIPVIVYFAVPLIAYLEQDSEEKTLERIIER